MWPAIAAVGASVVGGILSSRASASAAKKAASAELAAAELGVEFQREQLAEQQRQFDLQMQEYQRKQGMLEQNYAQMQQYLTPYIQSGQGALYEQMALAGVAAPGSPIQTPTTTGPTAPTVPSVAGPYMPGIRQEGAPATVTRDFGAAKPTGITTTATTPTTAPQQIGAMANDPNAQLRRQLIQSGYTSDQANRLAPPPAGTAADPTTGVAAGGLSGMQNLLGPVADIVRGQIQPTAEQLSVQEPLAPNMVNPYAGMTGEEAQAAALEKIASSPLLQELTSQGEQAILQQAAATGGLRGGNVQGALAQYRPQMLREAIQEQYSRLGGLSSTGQQSILQTPTVSPGNMPSYPGIDTSIASLIGQMGQANAQQALALGQSQAGLWQGLGTTGGLALSYLLNQPQTSNPYTGQAGMQAVYNPYGIIGTSG